MSEQVLKIWNSCLDRLSKEMSVSSFETWFKRLVPINLENNILLLQVPDKMTYEWIEENYLKIMQRVLRAELGSEAKLRYTLAPKSTNTSKRKKTERNRFESANYKNEKSQLMPEKRFSNLFSGDYNSTAINIAKGACEHPGDTSLNPFLLHSAVGLGKTHLLHAVGNCILEKDPSKQVLYVSAETFTSQFVHAVMNNERPGFLLFYQSLDVLLLDDVQYLGSKTKTQEAFFHIFNHLQQTGKQIIMTSDVTPAEMKGFEERLLSRFKWGIVESISAPTYEDRLGILRLKNDSFSSQLEEEVLKYIAHHTHSSIREIEGVFITLHSKLVFGNSQETPLELVKGIIKDVIGRKRETQTTPHSILEHVSSFFALKLDQMLSKSRKREFVQARQISMYLAHKHTPLSLKKIGQEMGGKDHGTVKYAIDTIQNLCENNKTMKQYIKDIEMRMFR